MLAHGKCAHVSAQLRQHGEVLREGHLHQQQHSTGESPLQGGTCQQLHSLQDNSQVQQQDCQRTRSASAQA
ncbi:hypothetical protein OEZ85_013582 [Tetradesmus obliquus]|uniref:Uncharacterized protein n=1 Tax=Tetradesmus obliquus TaxID=3088 RepID=A0ABY8UUC7_TETOB|nr:hypothetical protein OEZ85_013582 [Tetradesmus obliquus]